MAASEDFDDLGVGKTVAQGFRSEQKLFGRYTLKSILGRGGMGIVWRAFDEQLEMQVALKFLPDLIIHDRAVVDGLKRETKRGLELAHHHIVRIYGFSQDERSACISMEYVDGSTLSGLRVDRASKVFETDELMPLIEQTCDALDYAHTRPKIVHRDLKPSNLMLNSRGDVKVTDFGIARSLTDSVSMLSMGRGTSGTLPYMSPQQLDGERASHLDDIYSLGSTIYDLLTSKPPFDSGSIEHQIHEKNAPSMAARRADAGIESRTAIPRQWEETVAACLSKNPAERPQSAKEVLEGLHGRAAKRPKRRSAVAHAAGDKSFWSRRTLGAIGAAIIVVATGFLIAFAMRRNPPAQTTSSPTPAAATTVVAQPSPLTTAAPAPTAEKLFAEAVEYTYGMGRRIIDEKKAAELLEQAASQHFPEAAAWLVIWTKKGTGGITKDEVKAEEWAKRALTDGLLAKADRNIASAQTALAMLYAEGLGVAKDPAQKMAWYRKAADHGDSVAQSNFGWEFSHGDAVKHDDDESRSWLRKAAEQGNARAQSRLGHLLGSSPKEAVVWFTKAAEQGDSFGQKELAGAQRQLGQMYEKGEGLEKDNQQAVTWYRKAIALYRKEAEQGVDAAQWTLGEMYEKGQGVEKDVAQALVWYRKAAEKSSSFQWQLGAKFETGQGVVKDIAQALVWYGKAAEEDAYYQRQLGAKFENGQGVSKDAVEAATWYRKAAAQGDSNAQGKLGLLYDKGLGVEKNLSEAVSWYRKAADKGDAWAQYALGFSYENGKGVDKSMAQAVAWYQKAADGGSDQGQMCLANLYKSGNGVPKDLAKAAELFQKAATQGNFIAQNELGLLYQSGDGVSKDMAKAAELFQKAADQGYVPAQSNLGSLYETGDGVPKDMARAVQLYQKAADSGDGHAQYDLAALYEKGDGVPRDTSKAIALYRKAAAQGDKAAEAKVKKLSR